MGKRKTSSSEADFSEIDLSDSDDQYDESSRPKTRGKRVPKRQPSKKRTKHNSDGANDVSLSVAPPTHAKSMHVMKAAQVPSIRAALVQWYSGVHASRNMPWRKPYNPTLGPEERAQRAYEVEPFFLINRLHPYFMTGLDI